jgi:hypothetical protein
MPNEAATGKGLLQVQLWVGEQGTNKIASVYLLISWLVQYAVPSHMAYPNWLVECNTTEVHRARRLPVGHENGFVTQNWISPKT